MPLHDLPFKATLCIPTETERLRDSRPDIYETDLQQYDFTTVTVIGYKWREGGSNTSPSTICVLDTNSGMVLYAYPEWLTLLDGNPLSVNSSPERISSEKIKELLYDLGIRGLSDKQRMIVARFTSEINK